MCLEIGLYTAVYSFFPFETTFSEVCRQHSVRVYLMVVAYIFKEIFMADRVGQAPYIKAYYNDDGSIIGVENYLTNQSALNSPDAFLSFDEICVVPEKIRDGGQYRSKVSIFVDKKPACIFSKSKTEVDLLFSKLQKILAFDDFENEHTRYENMQEISKLFDYLYSKYSSSNRKVAALFIKAIERFGDDHVSQARIILSLFEKNSKIAEIVFHTELFEQAKRLLQSIVYVRVEGYDGEPEQELIFDEKGLNEHALGATLIVMGAFYNLSLLRHTEPTEFNYLGLDPLFYEAPNEDPLIVGRGGATKITYSLDRYTAGVLDGNLAYAAAAASIVIAERKEDSRDEQAKEAARKCTEGFNRYVETDYPECNTPLETNLWLEKDIRGDDFYRFVVSGAKNEGCDATIVGYLSSCQEMFGILPWDVEISYKHLPYFAYLDGLGNYQEPDDSSIAMEFRQLSADETRTIHSAFVFAKVSGFDANEDLTDPNWRNKVTAKILEFTENPESDELQRFMYFAPLIRH